MKPGLALLCLSAILASGAAIAHAQSAPQPAPDSGRGRQVYVQKGCYSCHGYDGQGGIAGPKIAPQPMGLEEMKIFIRNSGPTLMPVYSEKLVNDAEAAELHAWLSTRPAKKVSEIPLLSRQN